MISKMQLGIRFLFLLLLCSLPSATDAGDVTHKIMLSALCTWPLFRCLCERASESERGRRRAVCVSTVDSFFVGWCACVFKTFFFGFSSNFLCTVSANTTKAFPHLYVCRLWIRVYMNMDRSHCWLCCFFFVIFSRRRFRCLLHFCNISFFGRFFTAAIFHCCYFSSVFLFFAPNSLVLVCVRVCVRAFEFDSLFSVLWMFSPSFPLVHVYCTMCSWWTVTERRFRVYLPPCLRVCVCTFLLWFFFAFVSLDIMILFSFGCRKSF